MLKTTMTVAALGMMAAPAIAQELAYGSFSLDYTRISPDGGSEVTSFDLQGDAEFTFDQFVFGAAVSSDNVDFPEGPEFEVRSLSAFAAYAITPEALVGAGLTSISVEDFGEELNGFEVFGQYHTGAFGVAVNYTRPDNDFDDVDLTTYYAEAEVAPGVTLGAVLETFSEADDSAYFLSAEYDAGQIFGRAYYTSVQDADFAIFGARGEYRIDDAISVTGGIESLSGDEFFGEYTAFTIGGAYEFAPGVSADARYTSIDADGTDADGFAIGLTYEVGARQRLDRKMTEAIFDDLETGIFGLQPTVGIGIFAGGFGL